MSDDVFIKASELCIDFPIIGQHEPSGDAETPAASGRFITRNGGRYLRAIDSMSFEIGVGERVGIWGKNGSGKTTLLRTLRGVYPPTSGEIAVRGEVQSFFNLSFGMNLDATGYENIMLRGVLMGATPKRMREMTPEIAKFSELGEFLSMPVRSYSAGMRMRLAFSVAMSLPSDVLLMDEWLSVGDVDFRKKAADRLRDVVRASKVLVIASHNRRLLGGVCTRILTIDEGRIVADEQVNPGRSEEELSGFNEPDPAPL